MITGSEIEIEKHDEHRFVARLVKNGDYIREYGSPVIFRGKTEDEVRKLAEVYCVEHEQQP